MRIIVLFTALFMLAGAAAPLVAEAQPAPTGLRVRGTPHTTSVVKKHPHIDIV